MPDIQKDPRTAEEQLQETQQKLAEAEKQLAQAREALEKNSQSTPNTHKRPIEGIYDKINVPVKYVDYFIIAVIAAFVLVVGIGVLRGNGIM